MKTGVSIPNYGPNVSAQQLTRWAQLSERLSIDYAMVTDHIVQPPQVRQTFSEDFLEVFACLAYLAGITSRIRIGTTVAVLPLRHPLLTARTVATIDRLSGGRVILGVGVGGSDQEYDSLGVDFHMRGAMTDEYLEVLAKVWSGATEFHGRFVNFADLLPTPAPVQPGGPPIWVGGSATAALRRTVAYRGTWHPTFPTLPLLSNGIARMAEMAVKQGQPVPMVAPRIQVSITKSPLDPHSRALGTGSIEQIKEDMYALIELGISAVIVDPVRHPLLDKSAPRCTEADTERQLHTVEQFVRDVAQPLSL